VTLLPRLEDLRKNGVRAIVGPTASGKSALALAVCERAGAELVALDSMQVYRRMDIGTAKPSAAERARVRHHMLDLVEPHEDYDIARYLAELENVLADVAERSARVLFVGGTGFYLKVLLDGLFDGPPVDRALRAELESRLAREGADVLHAELARVDVSSAARIHARDTKRVVRALEVFTQTGRPLSDWQREWRSFGAGESTPPEHALVGLELATEALDARIRARTTEMIDAGWPAEAAAIESSGGFSKSSIQALGYATVLELAHGRALRAECEREIALATRQFARRQRTWYRKFDALAWLPADGGAENVDATLRALRW
jgi:tRNA dimethylallyltransferase